MWCVCYTIKYLQIYPRKKSTHNGDPDGEKTKNICSIQKIVLLFQVINLRHTKNTQDDPELNKIEILSIGSFLK